MASSQWHSPTIGPFVVCRCVFAILSIKAMVCLLPPLVHDVSATLQLMLVTSTGNWLLLRIITVTSLCLHLFKLLFIHLCPLFWIAVPVSVLRLSMEAVKWRMGSHWQCGPSRELLSPTTAQESCASRQTILMHLLPFWMFMVNAHHNTEIML